MKHSHNKDYEGYYFLTIPEFYSLFGFSHSILKRRKKSGFIPKRVKTSERRVGRS
tara:strand:+ start:445 stop:609 length:165 start_codon:yes stop_codon:yes gene_type:complete